MSEIKRPASITCWREGIAWGLSRFRLRSSPHFQRAAARRTMGGCGKPAASQAEANGGGARPAWNSFCFDSQPQRRSEIFKRGKLSKEEASKSPCLLLVLVRVLDFSKDFEDEDEDENEEEDDPRRWIFHTGSEVLAPRAGCGVAPVWQAGFHPNSIQRVVA